MQLRLVGIPACCRLVVTPVVALHVAHVSGHVPHVSGHVSHVSGHVPHVSGHVSHISGHVAHVSGHIAHVSRHVAAHVSGHIAHISRHVAAHVSGHVAHISRHVALHVANRHVPGVVALHVGPVAVKLRGTTPAAFAATATPVVAALAAATAPTTAAATPVSAALAGVVLSPSWLRGEAAIKIKAQLGGGGVCGRVYGITSRVLGTETLLTEKPPGSNEIYQYPLLSQNYALKPTKFDLNS
jgi:hypothetical protein